MKQQYRAFLLVLVLFVTFPIFSQSGEDVRVYTEQQDDFRVFFYADNDLFIPAYVSIDFQNLLNLEPDTEMPFGMRLEPESTRQYLFALEPGEGRRLSYKFSYTYTRGDPSSVDPDEDFLYRFPFTHGTKQRLTQGFNGRFTHMAENQYALDFDLEEGTEVIAAREGIVVEVKEDSNIGGPGLEYGPHANFVLIMHSDGTFGNYVHLRKNGAVVEAGENVTAGQLLGYSGNTGRSSGPHLHFDVRIPLSDGRMQSIPIKFIGLDNTPIDPAEDEIYYAVHEGGGDFEVIIGKNFTNSDFTGFRGRVAQTEKLEFRTEQTDTTYVIFIGNGFDYKVSAEVTLRLTRMESTLSSPVRIQLEPGEERFLTILRPIDGVENWSYGYSVSYRRLNN